MAHQPPTPEQAATFHALRIEQNKAHQLQIAVKEHDKKLHMESFYSDAINKAKATKKKLKSTSSVALSQTTELFVSSPEPVPSTSTLPIVPVQKDPFSEEKLASISYQITITPSSTLLPWYKTSPSSVTYDTLESAKVAGIWRYPRTNLEATRCKVFENLWSRGYFMGGGLKFGGDFLIYPGSFS